MNIELLITDITAENRVEKLRSAVSALRKALHFREKPKKTKASGEQSAYRAYRELEKLAESEVDARLYACFFTICRKWLSLPSVLQKASDDMPIKIDGRIRINPKTGKPLTRREWHKIERDLDRMLRWAFGDGEEFLARRAVALGKVLTTMNPEDAIDQPYQAVSAMLDASDPYLRNALEFAEQSAGTYITSIRDDARKRVKAAIIDAQKNRRGPRALERALFEQFTDTNRDWRRVAETEMASNFNAGQMLTELEQARREGEQHPLVMGVTAGGACHFCKTHIDGKIFALLDSAPADGKDTIMIEGETYTAIWPGKSNFGRKQANWWVAFPAHPHCRCSTTRYRKEFAKYHTRLRERMQARKK